MCRYLLLILTAAACSLSSLAQIEWLSTTYDFGSFREDGGPRQGQVQLVNRGSEPTAINRVKSTCGCTVAGYTEGLIAPGDTAAVWFTYNPLGRPGRFEKHIKVYTGTDNHLTSITILGTVIGSDASLSAKYPVEVGPMRISTTRIDLGKIPYGKARHEYISGYNRSDDSLSLAWTPTPLPLSLGVSNKRVAPGDIFMLGFYLNTRDETTMGPVEYPVRVYPVATDTTTYTDILIAADIVPDISSLSNEELRRSPMLMVYPEVIDLGTLKSAGKPTRFELRLRNEGESQLQIHRVFARDAKALTIRQLPSRIDAGKEFVASGELATRDMPAGPFAIEICVISSDPLHPTRTVRLVGTIAR